MPFEINVSFERDKSARSRNRKIVSSYQSIAD